MADNTPQGRAAQYFMAHKGYQNKQPYEALQLEGQDCWYFYYELTEGDLELEVYYNHQKEDWEITVTTFSRRPSGSNDRDGLSISRSGRAS